MLIKNFFREILSTLPRLMSVIVVTALGVFMFVGMSGINYNLIKIADQSYKEQNIADFWIYGTFSKADEKRILEMDEVDQIQPRIVLDAQPIRDKDITVTLHGISDNLSINKPQLKSGSFPKSNRDLLLFDEYAKQHNLKIGDTYELKIKNSKKRLTYNICGTARSVEYIYNIGGINLLPDNSKLGYGYIKRDSIEDILGENMNNQICVLLQDNTDQAKFRETLDSELGTKISAVLSFTDNKKTSILIDSINEMSATTTSLPSLFFLIAALIMFTTMTRVIENSRIHIGTLKAIGYSDLTIFIYYLCYAQAVVILGVLLGTLPSTLITKPLFALYDEMLSMPDYTIEYSMKSVIQSLIIANIFCTGTAAIICFKELKESPAECMRPKKPKTGNINLIEKIKFAWQKMTFSQKTIVRNIFRNKMRLVMCVTGVAGCMAIIITAFGMSDSNHHFFSTLFDKLHRYDLQVMLNADTNKTQYMRIKTLDEVDKCEYQMEVPATFWTEFKKESANISVVEDEISLMMLDISSVKTMQMPIDGAIVSSSLSKKLGLKEGDQFNVKLAGTNKTFNIKTARLLRNLSGIYIGKSYWRTLGEEFNPKTAYINSSNAEQLRKKLQSYDFVISALLKREVVESIESQLVMVNFVVFILTIFGGVLAFVVLYNLGVINFFERVRELATLMVLGFYDKEIRVLVLRENTIFTIIGIILGMPLGVWFHSYLMQSSQSAGFDVDVYISYFTYFIAVGLTFAFSLMVNLLLGKKFNQIDMVGALKSIE